MLLFYQLYSYSKKIVKNTLFVRLLQWCHSLNYKHSYLLAIVSSISYASSGSVNDLEYFLSDSSKSHGGIAHVTDNC